MSIRRIDGGFTLETSITKIGREIRADMSLKRHDKELTFSMSMRTINSKYFNAKYW